MPNRRAVTTISLPTTSRTSAVLAIAAALQLGAAAQAHATKLPGQFSGGAHSIGLTAKGDTVTFHLGTAAHAGCPCSGTGGVTRHDTVSSVAVGASGSILRAVTTEATAYSQKTSTTATTMQTDTVSHLNLFGGLITADSLVASASVGGTPNKLTTSDAGTTIVNLVVNGTSVAADVPRNTTLPLPGIGSVTVKAEIAESGKNKAHEEVVMLRVDVTQSNALGLPVGARFVVGQASAGYDRMQPQVKLGGFASGASAKGDAGSALEDGAGAGGGIGMPGCSGTGGATMTKSVTDVKLGTLLSLGTVTTTVFGGPVGSATVAKTTSTVSNVSLLDGLITAKSLVASAQESRTGTISTPSAAGSGFNGLGIAGLPIDVDTAPNTTIPLAGLGYVIVNKQTTSTAGLTVVALDIVVTKTNLLGLPVGTEIQVGHANAIAAKFN